MIDIKKVLDELNINYVVSKDNPIAIDVSALTDEQEQVLVDLLKNKNKNELEQT